MNREAEPPYVFVSERVHRCTWHYPAKTIPPAVGVASALRSAAGANKHESGAH